MGAVFAVHSAVLIVLEVPSGALADTLGRRRVLLVGAALTAASLGVFAVAQSVPAFMASVAALGTGRALISGALEAWYVDSLRAPDPRRRSPPGSPAGPQRRRWRWGSVRSWAAPWSRSPMPPTWPTVR